MQQVYTGPSQDAHEVVRRFTQLGIDAIGFSVHETGAMTLFVPPEDVEVAQLFVWALEDVGGAA